MTFRFSNSSLTKLGQIHPDLQKVVVRALALSKVDFGVLCGTRTIEEQRALVATRKSQTMHSRHLTGHAVDLGAYPNGKLDWAWEHYVAINDAMQIASKELGVPLEWGGEWKSIRDGDHWQLPFKNYP